MSIYFAKIYKQVDGHFLLYQLCGDFFAYATKQTATVFSINSPTGGNLATDIIVELEDRFLANVEVQKLGYSETI